MAVDATSLSDSEAANSALSTSYQTSSTFTPGIVVLDGVAIKIASRAAGSPSNTITVALDQAGSDVAGTPTTMNVSDIDVASTTQSEGGWYYFRFNVAGTPTPVTLAAATAYGVKAKLSATTTAVNLYSTATTNWSRMLATTTTGAPATGDVLHIMGDRIAAGTSNNFTVTMDNTATTSFGTLNGAVPIFSVNKGGTLTWGTTASTNYYLKIKGIVAVHSSGIWNMGTSGTRMPASSTAILEHDSTANVDSGFDIRSGATVNCYGDNARLISTKLNTDEAAASTVWGVVATTGWSNADVVAIASTTRTANQFEKRTISTVDSATQITVSAGLTNAHSGTSPTQAEVVNLTRNVTIRGVTSLLQGFIITKGTSVVNMDYIAMTQLGSNVGGKRCFDAQTTTGTLSVTNSSLFDCTFSNNGGFMISGVTAGGITFSSNVVYNITLNNFSVNPTTGTWTADSNIFIGSFDGGGIAVTIGDIGSSGTFTNNTIASMIGSAMRFGEAGVQMQMTFSGNTFHSNAQAGINFITNQFWGGTMTNTTIWRSNQQGLLFSVLVSGLTFNTLTMFGNSTANISVISGVEISDITFNSATLSGDTTFSTTAGFEIQSTNGGAQNCIFNSCDFGTVTGIKTAHTNDFSFLTATGMSAVKIYLNNTKLASATEINGQTSITDMSFVASEKHDQTAATHKTFMKYGTISYDASFAHTGSQSLKLTPSNASNKLISMSFFAAVASGNTVTPSVYVYENGAYNGNRARLIVKRNDAVGITSDTVLDTRTGASDATWELMSGTTASVTDDGVVEFVVDCDGTAGVVWVDSFTVA